MLQGVWNKLINLGTNSDSRDHANKKIRVINISLLISAFALYLFSILNWYLGFFELILLDFGLSLVAVLCIYLNAKRQFSIAHFVAFGLFPGIFFVYPYFIGNIGVEYYYFFLLVVGFYILDNKIFIFVFSIYIFLLFVASKYIIYHNNFDEKYLILETVHYYPSIIASVIMVLIATYVFKSDTLIYQQAIEIKNFELEQVKEQINKQNELLEEHNLALANLHKNSTASLSYARQIQKSIIQPETFISKYFKSFFVLNKPKNIVSGDFYWFKDLGETQLIAIIDCTGHGVPGAFMTAMANTLLNEIVDHHKITIPGKILEELKIRLTQTLNIGIHDNQVNDGMDLAICSINKANCMIEFAGARRPLYQFRSNDLIEHKATRSSIDAVQLDKIYFETKQIKCLSSDRFYLCTDGYADQFGGTESIKEKFLKKRLIQLLKNIQSEPLTNHKQVLANSLRQWQNNEDQTDDILVIGFEL